MTHSPLRAVVYAAIDAGGRLREGCAQFGLTTALRYLSVRGLFGAHVNLGAMILQLLRRRLTLRPDLSRLAQRAKANARTAASEAD